MSPRLGAWLGGGAIAASLVAFTSQQEGTVLEVYKDPIPNKVVLTVCTGETNYVTIPGDIRLGAKFTPEECAAALERSLWTHAQDVIRCTAPAQLTPGQKMAFLDFAYNAGGTNFCNSSMARNAKAGNVRASCDALLMWRNAGGKDCSVRSNGCWGVWLRRQEERKICLADAS